MKKRYVQRKQDARFSAMDCTPRLPVVPGN